MSRQILIFPKKKKPSPSFIDPLKEKREENSPQFSASRSFPLRGGGLIPSRPDGSRVYSSRGIAYYASSPPKNRHAFWEENWLQDNVSYVEKGDEWREEWSGWIGKVGEGRRERTRKGSGRKGWQRFKQWLQGPVSAERVRNISPYFSLCLDLCSSPANLLP